MSSELTYNRIRQLIAEFPRFLQAFVSNPPFNRAGQLEYHLATIQARGELGSVEKALANDQFIRSLYRTLQAWGIGVRASHMLPEEDFGVILREKASDIAEFDGMCLDDPSLNVTAVSDRLWRLVSTLGIVSNDANIVPGTKALHHILPDLIVPVDRAYTQNFFGWHNPQFQYDQDKVFRRSFAAFVKIARGVDPAQYVEPGWNSSRTKVIDNAIVGMVRENARAS